MNETRPPIELTFEARAGYLFVHARAETTTPETTLQFMREVAKQCAEAKLDRVLLFRDIPDTLSLSDFFLATETLLEGFRGIRGAVVNPYPVNAERLEFGSLVALNRGVTYKIFTNETEAEAWLLQDLPE